MSENVDDVFSDEDLPDILENNNESGPEETEIYKGAIVWAEFRKIYWPALVRSVNKRNRKACVWYLDSPKKCFKLPFNKILSFHDKKVNDKIKEEAKNSPMKEHHDKVLNRTLTYLHRKSLGINDDPADYFDFEKPYFALCLSSASENTDKNNKTGIVRNTEESDDDDNDDDEDSAESIPDDEMITDFRNSLCETDDSVEDEVVNSLVDCIKMGNTNEHLLQVRFGKIPSTWRAAYDEAVKTNLKKLWYIDTYGPVKNFEKLKEICLYLLNFYEKVVESGKCEMTAYVMSVWLPESITKAISIVKKVSLETARELFLNNHKIETTSVKRELIFSTAGEVSNEAVNQFSDKISPSTAEILTTESTHGNASQKVVEDTTDSSFNKDLSSSKLDRKTNVTSKVLSPNSECELTGNKASSSVRRKKATKKRKTAWSRGILPKRKKKSKIA